MATYQYTAGRTKPIIHQLLRRQTGDKREQPFDATGTTLALVLTKADGTAVTTTGNVDWDDAVESKAKYTPDAADLAAADSPLTAHWKITDGADIFFVPQGPGDTWEIS
jgi:hypothetical protein